MNKDGERFTERELAFLRDLEAVYQKHGLFMWSCGCCNTPSIEKTEDGDRLVHMGGGEVQMGQVSEWYLPVFP